MDRIRGVAVAAALAALLAGVFFFLWLSARGVSPDAVGDLLHGETAAVVRTSTTVIDAITNYDALTFEETQRTLLPVTTGAFRRDYEELLPDLDRVLRETSARAEGRIVDGPEASFTDADRAVSIARVVQDVTTAEDRSGRTIFMVLELGLVKENGRWRADNLDILSQTST